jgi:protein-S-isoprenylcysteine O-methyltransferase Ste14
MGPWLLRFARIIGFVLIITVWSWLNRNQLEPSTSIIITIGGVLVVFPIVWIGRRWLDVKPTPERCKTVTTGVHYAVVPLFGAAIFEAIKVGRAWAGWVIPLPREIGWMLMIVTGAVVLLTVLNLALGGLGAPFAVALSKRLAANWLYAWTRNPMVLSTIAFLISVGLWLQSTLFILWMIVLVIPAWLFLLKVFEERELEIRFGATYLEYKARTPMLWLRRPKHSQISATAEKGKR